MARLGLGLGLCRSSKGTASAGNPHTIISVTDDGTGYALFTTEAPHGLTTGNYVDISGTEIYDGSLFEYRDPESPSPVQFRLLDVSYGGSATGTWALVEV